jgi:hypothetical protein
MKPVAYAVQQYRDRLKLLTFVIRAELAYIRHHEHHQPSSSGLHNDSNAAYLWCLSQLELHSMTSLLASQKKFSLEDKRLRGSTRQGLLGGKH